MRRYEQRTLNRPKFLIARLEQRPLGIIGISVRSSIFVEIDSTLYRAMAHVGGKPLSALISAEKPLSGKQASACVRKLTLNSGQITDDSIDELVKLKRLTLCVTKARFSNAVVEELKRYMIVDQRSNKTPTMDLPERCSLMKYGWQRASRINCVSSIRPR